ncbi:MAG: hypothetical protein ABI852_05505 [Gemmatimonadaceae bacterium]
MNVTEIQVVRLVRSTGYTGAVTLSMDSLPLGVTATFDPPALGGAGTTSILTLTAAANAVAGTTLTRIKATGQNAPADSTNVSVTVVTGVLDLASAATNVTVATGTTGSVPLTLTRSNGFIGQVGLTVEGLPANVTATFTPALLPTGTTVSTLTLAVASGAPPASLALTVRAKGTGVADKTVPLQLTIVPSASADFVLSASPAAQSLVAGTSGTATVSLGRTGGFAGNVAFALTGLPNGVTGVFTPNPATANTSALALASTPSVVPGDYNLTLTGTSASGGLTHSIPMSLRITPAPAIAIRLLPDSAKIAPSGFAQSAVLITRVGGFTGDFTMTATGLPTGVTATFGSSVVTGTATSLTFSATATAAAGVYNVVIKAAAGSDSGSATLVLTVGTAAIK